MLPKRSPERLGRPLGAHLGALESLLGGSWGALGGSWGALGRFWGGLGGLFDSSETLLDRPWSSEVDFGPSEGRFWGRFSSLWVSIFRPQAECANRLAGRQTDTRCEAKARRVYQSRRQTDRHTTLRSKSSTT